MILESEERMGEVGTKRLEFFAFSRCKHFRAVASTSTKEEMLGPTGFLVGSKKALRSSGRGTVDATQDAEAPC